MKSEEDIAQYLDPGMFPATRDEVILMAEENDAPFEIMDALVGMPDEVYNNIHEVWALVTARKAGPL